MFQPSPEETFAAYPAVTLVNSPRNNRPECVARVNICKVAWSRSVGLSSRPVSSVSRRQSQ